MSTPSGDELPVATIKLTYFRRSGKYYTDDTYQGRYGRVGPRNSTHPFGPFVDMNEVWEDVKQRAKHGQLPGLATGRWNGPVVVDCEDGFPHLLFLSDEGE